VNRADGGAAHDVEARQEPEPLRQVVDQEGEDAGFVGAARAAAGEYQRNAWPTFRFADGPTHRRAPKKSPGETPGPTSRESG
jgi:hypothetical protein